MTPTNREGVIKLIEKWIEENGHPKEDEFGGTSEAQVMYAGYCFIIGNQIIKYLEENL